MTTAQDCSLGIGVESTHGTGVTPTRWLEFVDESFKYNKNVKQGQGLRAGARVDRAARRVVPTADASGDVTIEALSKGMGLFWQACLGAGVSTLVSAGLYQQVFTLADIPPSLTIQKGLPRADGTLDAYTYLGCMVDQIEISAPNGDIVTTKATFDCKDVTTATAYAAPSYAVGGQLFHFSHGVIASGVLTAPTATTLASGTTVLANIRSFNLTVKHNLTNDRFNFGGSGRKDKPTVGKRDITGTLEGEYASATARDAVLNDTGQLLILTFTAPGGDVLQVVVPEIRLESELPTSNKGDLIMQSQAFTGLDNLAAAQPIWVVVRTSDAAL